MEEGKTKVKKTLTETINEHPKTVFWLRFVAWVLCSCVLPFAFIAWRYGIFTQDSKLNLSGWGIIGVVIVIAFIISLIKYAYKGMKPGLLKQCITGLVAIILPLTVLLLVVSSIESNIALFKQALGCVILCEAVGIPLNPLPSWLEKRRAEQQLEQTETLSEVVFKKFFEEKKKNGE